MSRLVVDAMNVIGSRPNGWWRNRDGAVRELADRLRVYARSTSIQVMLVIDGYPVAELPAGDDGLLQVRYADSRARDAADDRIVELLGELADELANRDGTHLDVVVVTADRDLRRRAGALGAELMGPRLLLGRLDEAGC